MTKINTPYGLRVLRQDGGGHYVNVNRTKQYVGGASVRVTVLKPEEEAELSPHALIILHNKFHNTAFIVREYLGHDGFDEDGPQSNLWDLHVQVISGTEQTPTGYYKFHTEDWFNQGEVQYDQEIVYTLHKPAGWGDDAYDPYVGPFGP